MQDIGLFTYHYFHEDTNIFIYNSGEFWSTGLGTFYDSTPIKQICTNVMAGHPLVVSDTEVQAWRI